MGRILVADDDPDLLDLVCFVLKGAGHEVRAARDGGEALAQALGGDFELLVLDVMMPVLSGLDVVAGVRSAADVSQPAVLMLSALSSQADVRAGRAAGADDYLSKPFAVAELARRVQTLLDARGPAA